MTLSLIMRPLRHLRARFRRFGKDEEGGSLSLEMILFAGLMSFTSMMLFTYWEAYRVRAVAGNATFVIADMISREGAPINTGFINGMGLIYRYITRPDQDLSWIRVTSIEYRETQDVYRVLWSRSTNDQRAPRLTDANIAQMRDERIPDLEDGATLILVESWREFRPAFRVGLEPRIFYSSQFTWPRFLSPLPMS